MDNVRPDSWGPSDSLVGLGLQQTPKDRLTDLGGEIVETPWTRATLTKGYTANILAEVALTDATGDLETRWQRMNGLLEGILSKYPVPKVLDLALGIGHDSIALKKRGYEVLSNEIDEALIPKALANAQQEGVYLDITKVYWQDFPTSPQFRHGDFQLILSLGNSFPAYLLNEEERHRSLRSFWSLLQEGGTLVFDTRNFDYIVDKAEEILEDPERNFPYLGRTTCLNTTSIKGFPVEITASKIHFLWKNYLRQEYSELDLWPATRGNVIRLVRSALGEVPVQVLFDYSETRPWHHDFVQYVLKKI